MESGRNIQDERSLISETQAMVTLSHEEAIQLSRQVLSHHGYAADHADAITRNVVKVQMGDEHAHGLYRLLDCVERVRQKKVDPKAKPVEVGNEGSVIRMDAHGGYSLLAFEMGLPKLMDRARQQGIAALSIHHTFHCSALWTDVEAIAAEGLVGIALKPSQWVMSSIEDAAIEDTALWPGCHPMAFAWPRPGDFPYAFDWAPHCGVRDAGDGDQGLALSVMIELMAGPLIGDHLAYSSGAHAETCTDHGELIIALNPPTWLGARTDYHFAQAEKLLTEIEGQGSRLLSQRRLAARKRNQAAGTMTISQALYERLRALLDEGR